MLAEDCEACSKDTGTLPRQRHNSVTRPALTSIEPSHTAPVNLHIFLGQFVMCWDEFRRKIDLLEADDEQERASIEGSMPALVEGSVPALVVETLGG